MDIYSLQRLAYMEHNQMVKSLPKVYDFEYPIVIELSLWSRLIGRLRALAGHVRTSPPNPPHRSRPVLTVSNPSPLLRDMVREDSNLELDWLWAAGQVATPEEMRYCLERALYIDPNNRETQRALSKSDAHRPTDETVPVKQQEFARVSNH